MERVVANGKAHAVAEEWRAHSLRLTIFGRGTEIQKASARDSWAALLGGQPDEIREKPRSGESTATGGAFGKRLLLAAAPERIDWVFAQSATPKDLVTGEWSELGAFAESLDSTIGALANLWFQETAESTRIALGCSLFVPVPDRVAGYEYLRRFLHSVNLDPKGSSDFQSQINRPRIVDGVTFNRLTQWAVLSVQSQRLAVQLRPGAAVSEVGTFPEDFSCRLDIDLNTGADNTEPFTQEVARGHWETLMKYAKEIAEQGEIG